jgi:hypothetical protein
MPDSSFYRQLDDEWKDLITGLSKEPVSISDWSFVHDQKKGFRPSILFAELEDTRSLWAELRRTVSLDDYAERFITPAWTLKDMIAHVASWASELRSQTETVLCGEAFDYAIPYALSIVGPNQWNQNEVEKRRSYDLGDSLKEIEEETGRFENLVLDLSEESLQIERDFALAPNGDPSTRWRSNIGQIVLLKCSHERYHLERIRQWQNSLSSARLIQNGRARKSTKTK